MNYCLADCYIAAQDVWVFGVLVIPVTVLFLLYFFNAQGRACSLIREGSRRMIWRKQGYKGALFSIMMTSYFQGCIFIAGGLASRSYINWSSTASLFFYNTEYRTSTVCFPLVLAVSSVIVFLKFFSISLMVIFALWAAKSKELVIIFVVALAGAELFLQNKSLQLFYNVLNASYDKWLSAWKMTESIIYGIVLAVLIWHMGKSKIMRKDFFL